MPHIHTCMCGGGGSGGGVLLCVPVCTRQWRQRQQRLSEAGRLGSCWFCVSSIILGFGRLAGEGSTLLQTGSTQQHSYISALMSLEGGV